ncbi:ferritin-like domain-containing protein [Flavobacterium ajazii]|uniref:ferritin-like domain-containing protein n=1 Tax=Flavobacterium ajazii TaxID=2692318 RepID=UPI0013D80987|nr:ferritin-like domain-containing protein [Flavobacterium ajazii]
MKNEVKIQEVNPILDSRRSFLKLSGLTMVTAGLVLAGCSDNDNDDMQDNSLPGIKNGIFDLGSGDFGVLTYAYALEQLEADFYTKVVNSSNFNTTFNDTEREVLTDLYHHEVVHRDFFKAALTLALPDPGTQLLPSLAFNYGSLNFNSRNEVLATAKALEDTGVAAYNGAGKLIKSADYLLLAGKIVSVEARHASAIRSLINPNSKDFAGDDIVSASTGLDAASNPSKILPIAGGFITTKFTAKYLP